MNYMKIIILAVLLLSTVITASAEPLTMVVTPINDNVMPGEVATYQVDLTNGGTSTEVLTDIYVVTTELDVTFTFSEATGTIPSGTTKTVTLSAQVPSDKPAGTYTFDVFADFGVDFGGFVVQSSSPAPYLNVLLTVIPEFPTIALPVISVLGMMMLMSRREENH